MNRKDKIILFSGIGFLTISYIIYNKWSKSILYEEILKRIGGGSLSFEDADVFNATPFKAQFDSQTKPYVQLQQSAVKEYAEGFRDAIQGVGTSESKIISLFRELSSKYEVAQVISFYNAKYKRDLKEDLKGELSKYWLNQIGTIISYKPNVIFIN